MKIKVFYILHAGGFASSLNAILPYFNESIELIVIEYAGRGIRSSEVYYNNFNEMVQDIYKQIMKQTSNNDFIIWGHSLGAIVAYEICHLLQDADNKNLKHVIISGQDAPNYDAVRIRYSNLSGDERKKQIISFGGIKNELEKNTEWLQYFINYIESDLFLLEKYTYITRKKLNYQCLLLQGKEDESINLEKSKWDELFTHEVKCMTFNGGHFFMFDNTLEVITFINEYIKT